MKTRKQKYMIMLACVFLLASFICIPVAAAISDDGQSQYDIVEFDPQSGDDTSYFVVYDQGPFNDPFSVAASQSWSTLKNSTPILSSTRYPLLIPLIDRDIEMFSFSFSSSDTTLAASYAFLGQGAIFSSDDSTAALQAAQLYLLNYGLFYISYGVNSATQFTALRFSLRTIGESASGTSIGSVVAYTDTFYPTMTSDGQYYFTEVYVSNWRFAVRGNQLTGDDYILCVDMAFTSDLSSNRYEVAMGSPTGLKIYRFTDQGAAYPYYPELSNPLYQNPDMTTPDYLAGLEGYVKDQYNVNDTSNYVTSLLSDVELGISDFTLLFLRMSSILDYFKDTIPHFSFVITFSLILGVVALLFGFAHSIFGASESKSPRLPSRRNSPELPEHKKSD